MINEYKKLLKYKLSLFEQMYYNTVNQREAISQANDAVLENTIKTNEKFIKEIDKVEKDISNFHKYEDDETNELKKLIDLKLREIYKLHTDNILAVKKLEKEISKNIKNIKQGKKALTNGYFKAENQQYGYFIDKKIGK